MHTNKYRVIVDAIPNDGGSRFEVGRVTLLALDRDSAIHAAVEQVWDRRLEITCCVARCSVRCYPAPKGRKPRAFLRQPGCI